MSFRRPVPCEQGAADLKASPRAADPRKEEGAGVILLRMLYIVGCRKGRFPMPTWNRKGSKNAKTKPKVNQHDATVSQGTPQNAPWGTGAVEMRRNIQKERIPWHEMGTIFDNNRKVIIPQIII